MKKNYLFLVTLLLFSVIGFTGCSDDDDSVNASALLGEWQSTYEYAYETEGGEMYPLEDGPYTDEVWTFYEDGRCIGTTTATMMVCTATGVFPAINCT